MEIVQQIPTEGLPEWCPEPAIASLPEAPASPTIDSHTFSILRDDKWALQNFLPAARNIVEIYPNRSEMRLLRSLRMGRMAIVAGAILCIFYLCVGVIQILRQPEWAFDASQSEAAKTRLAKMNAERLKSEHWGNLLEDRSKAWTVMESLSRMFPENAGMLVKTFNHAAKPESTPGLAKVGFIKEWKITGYARDEALEYLNTINTREGISAHFTEIGRITGNGAFNTTTGTRNLVINVRTQENAGYKPIPLEDTDEADEATYPFTFDMTITQRFEATDPMAVMVSKAPL